MELSWVELDQIILTQIELNGFPPKEHQNKHSTGNAHLLKGQIYLQQHLKIKTF